MGTISEILTLNNNSPLSPLDEENTNITSVVWHARKTVLAIIEWFSFMSLDIDFNQIKYMLVWCGASGSYNFVWTNVIASLYPNIKIYLYLPKEVPITNIDSVVVVVPRTFSNKDVITTWASRAKETVILGMHLDKKGSIENSMAEMRVWINGIQPLDALVYYRTPDYRPNGKKNVYTFLKGPIFAPIYDNPSESYAWVKPERYFGKYVELNLDAKTWNGRMKYFNNVTRGEKTYPNPLTIGLEDKPIYEEAGIFNSYDNYAETLILDRFFYQFTLKKERSDYIKAMIDSISKILTDDGKLENPLLE